MTYITVRILGANDSAALSSPSVPGDNGQLPHTLTCGVRKVGALRQSKRLRQVKEQGERRRLPISRDTTVKDIKVMVSLTSRCFFQVSPSLIFGQY
jgi:ubiquitin carboxyl-terminal hydrolase 48